MAFDTLLHVDHRHIRHDAERTVEKRLDPRLTVLPRLCPQRRHDKIGFLWQRFHVAAFLRRVGEDIFHGLHQQARLLVILAAGAGIAGLRLPVSTRRCLHGLGGRLLCPVQYLGNRRGALLGPSSWRRAEQQSQREGGSVQRAARHDGILHERSSGAENQAIRW